MSVPVHCHHCGYEGVSRVLQFANVKNATLGVGSEPCPRCGRQATIQAGTYDFVGEVMTAFRAPEVTRESVADLRKIVESAASGEITADEAFSRAENVSSPLGALLRAAHAHGITFDRVLAVILAIHAFWQAYASDADVQAALAESRTQTELAQRMLEESQAQSESLRGLVPRSASRQPPPKERAKPKNRAERRRDQAIERKKSKRASKGPPAGR